ncbi:MAG: T9SS C-terminal target domain-containing protein [Porphyromonadaceae bacterium]|nr:MAG: T9SS C-terminal target domain-containing protein [Porphyromonadaceae bacterium]
MEKLKFFVSILIVAVVMPCFTVAQQAPFNRGVNLTGWFQTDGVRQIQFNRYSRKDFENIKSLGCDVIRLPVNLHFMTNGQPEYRIDPLFFDFLDQIVTWAEDLNLFLILDNHTFDPAANTDPNIGSILEKVWLQMALHFKDRSQYILYEVLNEPHGIADQLWNTIQLNVINKIRSVDTRHTIVVGPASWNSYNNLANLPRYTDSNLLYTFHFYDPFLFTHQGATWVDPSMALLAGVPFPYRADSMPVLPASLSATWVGDAFRNYANDGTVQKVKQLIDIAVRFRTERNVPVFCGEFGVYIPNSYNNHRVYWYEVVRKYLEEKQIAWTSWDYHGGFGLFKAGSNGLFEHDLNVPLLRALGLIIPDQSDYSAVPDSTGSMIYSDLPGDRLFESSYNNGTIDYYSMDRPNNGKFCLKWTGALQYNTIGLDYLPDRDFSELVKKNFALDMIVRGDTPGLSFQIRFLDSKTPDAYDYPWRMGITINDQMAPWDRKWHHLYIPFSELAELGAWYNNWYNPQGKFDWKAIDRIEIVAENGALGKGRFWFDNIQITDQDTAQIFDTSVFVDNTGYNQIQAELNNVHAWPNPAVDFLNIETSGIQPVNYQVLDFQGRVMSIGSLTQRAKLNVSAFTDGIYFLQVFGCEIIRFCKMSSI